MEVGKYTVVLISALLILATFALAQPITSVPANDNAKENSVAPEHSPVIDAGWGLARVDFIHYAKPQPFPSTQKPSACYKLLGVKWKSQPVSYVINPSNPQGLSEAFVTSAIYASAETWDAATSSELFSDAYTVDYTAQYGVLDGKNSIVFGDYDTNVIGVTSVWYTRIGKQIVEFDMLLNTDYAWGDATVNSTKMDLQNIVTHEKGHAVGLGDIYSPACNTVTMYGYSGYGETSKRTLEQPDVTGLQKMYGV